MDKTFGPHAFFINSLRREQDCQKYIYCLSIGKSSKHIYKACGISSDAFLLDKISQNGHFRQKWPFEGSWRLGRDCLGLMGLYLCWCLSQFCAGETGLDWSFMELRAIIEVGEGANPMILESIFIFHPTFTIFILTSWWTGGKILKFPHNLSSSSANFAEVTLRILVSAHFLLLKFPKI